jgi:hypothetical protein
MLALCRAQRSVMTPGVCNASQLGQNQPRRGARSPSILPLLVGLASLPSSIGCESEQVAVVHLSVGSRPEDHRSFQPKASLAEYTEIPGSGSELRVVLSSRLITCDAYLPLEANEVMITLTFSVPAGQSLSPGAYPWPGFNLEPSSPSANTADGGVPRSQVMPYVRLGKQGKELPPGGHVELTEVRLDAQGAVRGLLRLEQPGSAGLPETSLLGSFSARWCRISTAAGSDGS